jgi:NitT/TauT family transport system substrate-binding protein
LPPISVRSERGSATALPNDDLMTRTTISRSTAIALIAAAAAIPRRTIAQASTVRVGASAAATQAEAYYGEQLGMFKQAGITTQQTIVTRSSDTLSAMIRGDLDVGSTTPQAIANAIIHGIPIQVIATGAVFAGDPVPVQLLVSKKAPLRNDAKAYEHATVAVQTLNDSQSLGVLAWLQRNHVSTSSVKFIEITFPTMAAALDRGEVTAACMVEPFISAHRELVREVPHVYDALGHHWALGAWYAKRGWIEKNPALAKTFVATLYATGKRVNANPASIDELLTAYSKIPLESIRVTPKPIWAEAPERSNLDPQIEAAAAFKLIARAVSYHELTGA